MVQSVGHCVELFPKCVKRLLIFFILFKPALCVGRKQFSCFLRYRCNIQDASSHKSNYAWNSTEGNVFCRFGGFFDPFFE